MNKADKVRIQNLAKKIMRLDNQIWDKHGWKSGSDVVDSIQRKELRDGLSKMGVSKVDGVISHILEDANYHSTNSALDGLYDKSYEDSENDYIEYRKLGGKTWEL